MLLAGAVPGRGARARRAMGLRRARALGRPRGIAAARRRRGRGNERRSFAVRGSRIRRARTQ